MFSAGVFCGEIGLEATVLYIEIRKNQSDFAK
jgi:hypothetical protein